MANELKDFKHIYTFINDAENDENKKDIILNKKSNLLKFSSGAIAKQRKLEELLKTFIEKFPNNNDLKEFQNDLNNLIRNESNAMKKFIIDKSPDKLNENESIDLNKISTTKVVNKITGFFDVVRLRDLDIEKISSFQYKDIREHYDNEKKRIAWAGGEILTFLFINMFVAYSVVQDFINGDTNKSQTTAFYYICFLYIFGFIAFILSLYQINKASNRPIEYIKLKQEKLQYELNKELFETRIKMNNNKVEINI